MKKLFWLIPGLVVVCVALAAPAVFADTPGDAVPVFFSLRFIPDTEPMTARDYQSPEPVAVGSDPLSVKRAVLYSLLLPGLGDYYAGRKTRATAFFMVEAGIWVSYGVLKSQSAQREDAFQEMAVRFAGVSASGLSDEYYSTIGQYNTHREYEAEFKSEHRFDIWPNVGYEAMDLYYVVRVGVYDQGVVAVCDTINKAKNAAVEAKKLERDNYHDFEIRQLKLNVAMGGINLYRYRARRKDFVSIQD